MILGIDAGSKFLKISRFENNEIDAYIYEEHFGAPEKLLTTILNGGSSSNYSRLIFTGHYADYLTINFSNSCHVDEVSTIIEALNYLNANFRYIVNVGAGSIKLIELDKDGNFYSYKENSLCAAGTGSFLDEQMVRMNLNYEKLKTMEFVENAPDIATRCAVFAKSDLIHRQQEGYTREEMWSGLCRGVVTTMLQSIFKGDFPPEAILFSGGLFLNPFVRKWLRKNLKNANFLDNGHFLSSIGSLVSYRDGLLDSDVKIYSNGGLEFNSGCSSLDNLSIVRSEQTDFSAREEYLEDENEVRLHTDIGKHSEAAIGIDIGSTSTKLVVISPETKEVLIDIYRKTRGNPLEAARKLFGQLRKLLDGKNISVTGVGTTGSGRKMIGQIIGADVIVNEITAHFRGATYFDKSIDTIFEIGGQDSKYIRGNYGKVVDCNMNFVCAAGTGSFIEEQANRLGFDIRDVGDIVLGLDTPGTSDRCTVFMEQDINKLLRDGYSREQVLAGVIRSIAKNYLNRVVGSRPVSGNKISFMGATARNRGIVAAFESILAKEIVVSPYCHVMGAFGAALTSLKSAQGKSKFHGLDILEKNIELDYKYCGKCTNNCKITIAGIDGLKEESWGYMCGKEKLSDSYIKNYTDHFKIIGNFLRRRKAPGGAPKNTARKKRGVVGIPIVLSMYNYYPLWKTFFEDLGYEVIQSGMSSPEIKITATKISKADFCFPLKMSIAHILKLSEDKRIDKLFFPSFISEKLQENGLPRVFCPYVISYPSILKNFLENDDKLISPSIDFRFDEKTNINFIYESLNRFGISYSEIKHAYRKGMAELDLFFAKRHGYGRKILNEIQENGRTAIVVLGRPYNLYDRIINLKLTERLRQKNIEVIPYECLIDPAENETDIYHMYWNYGEKILNISKKIKDLKNVYPVYFSNFSCGPDSFILSRFEKIMQDKPYLIIELDDHGSETGYITRIEAFMDVISEEREKLDITKNIKAKFHDDWRKESRKLWLPPLHDIGARLLAAGFRAWGYDAEVLPVEDNIAFELGKQNIRGSECLPAATTIGVFLKKLREINAKPSEHALLMGTAEGPCRFGQYSVLHKNILNSNGYEDTLVFSPSSINTYMGIPNDMRKYQWKVIVTQDMLTKYICKIRPYEVNHGDVDAVAEEVISDIEKRIEKREDLIIALGDGLEKLSRVPIEYVKKPLVGIVGEIYVRCNPFCNNYLIRHIEKSGGEAWLAPVSEWFAYTAWFERHLTRVKRDNYLHKTLINLKTGYLLNHLHKFEESVEKYLYDRMEPDVLDVINEGAKHLPLMFEGESILTIGRAVKFIENGADMVVNCAPFGCMPGNITNSLFHELQGKYKTPIISLFYDGESDVNRIVSIYLENIRKGGTKEKKIPVK